MFKKNNQNKDYIQSIINKKKSEYILKHKYCTELYHILQNEKKYLSISIIGKIIGMIYENHFSFIETCYTDKEYFLNVIVNDALQLLSENNDANKSQKVNKKLKII